jgi:hypothetical protein
VLVVPAKPCPGLDLVRQTAQRHRRILGGLVLEQQDQQRRFAAVQPYLELQIAMMVDERGIDGRCAVAGQRVPGDRRADLGRQERAQQRRGMSGRFERGFEQCIVRARRHGVGGASKPRATAPAEKY